MPNSIKPFTEPVNSLFVDLRPYISSVLLLYTVVVLFNGSSAFKSDRAMKPRQKELTPKTKVSHEDFPRNSVLLFFIVQLFDWKYRFFNLPVQVEHKTDHHFFQPVYF